MRKCLGIPNLFGCFCLLVTTVTIFDEIKTMYHQSRCKCIFDYILWMIITLTMMLMPSFVLLICLMFDGSDPGYRSFECTIISNEYIKAILQYTINNASRSEIKRRIIACNYCLIAILSSEIEESAASVLPCREPELLINFIANMHNNNIGNGVE